MFAIGAFLLRKQFPVAMFLHQFHQRMEVLIMPKNAYSITFYTQNITKNSL
jgi:hypothetical protein